MPTQSFTARPAPTPTDATFSQPGLSSMLALLLGAGAPRPATPPVSPRVYTPLTGLTADPMTGQGAGPNIHPLYGDTRFFPVLPDGSTWQPPAQAPVATIPAQPVTDAAVRAPITAPGRPAPTPDPRQYNGSLADAIAGWSSGQRPSAPVARIPEQPRMNTPKTPTPLWRQKAPSYSPGGIGNRLGQMRTPSAPRLDAGARGASPWGATRAAY